MSLGSIMRDEFCSSCIFDVYEDDDLPMRCLTCWGGRNQLTRGKVRDLIKAGGLTPDAQTAIGDALLRAPDAGGDLVPIMFYSNDKDGDPVPYSTAVAKLEDRRRRFEDLERAATPKPEGTVR